MVVFSTTDFTNFHGSWLGDLDLQFVGRDLKGGLYLFVKKSGFGEWSHSSSFRMRGEASGCLRSSTRAWAGGEVLEGGEFLFPVA